MLSTANITQQFGAKPLFENISIKFGEGNRYALSAQTAVVNQLS
ncbi:hypothetical protein JCM19240_2682 [Vibrio maritimus]|uniref:Uncharacterized protein n=1 Tax=Vibrio maritimus TaxID=990268 RepID=A0A090TBG7_9VIBR|nr:hypothetical protein JCM19240_2682 [Vibrio maritimus]